MASDHHIPHSLRIATFLLRVAIGFNLFYLGWTALFNHALGSRLRDQSFGSLYVWLSSATPFAAISASVFAWLFLILGACIVIGLFTRLASFLAIALILVSWLPIITFSHLSPVQFINDSVIAILCLLVLIFAKAGTYLGLDSFMHFGTGKKKV